ncbi:MAG TPA: glycosyltransferase 87 family protein [Solirubrobacteraceae bacterium]|nr:glycosyltransferase 87 family protein [Solirubrobacteraceae bacterium]
MRVPVKHVSDAALVAVALLISVHAALAAPMAGDYPGDGGPALAALLHGNLQAFASATPAMGDLSLLIRAPFAALAYVGRPTELEIYRWGVLPCALSVAVLALWLAGIARARGTGVVGQWAIVLVALVNPLVSSAIALGHPEELMTSSLCVGALIVALDGRIVSSAVLLGLALACKQWAVVAVLPVLFALERGRVRALLGALATAAIVTVPEVVGAPMSYLNNQLFLARGEWRVPSTSSWWWPIAPTRVAHVLRDGNTVALTYRRLPAIADSLHSLIVAVDVLVVAVVARARRLPLRRDDAFALMAIVMLLRCTLDTETMPYFHTALLLDLLAWDALAGERLPLRALAGAAVSYVLFERLSAGPIEASSLAYAAATVVALLLFVRTLVARASSPVRPLPRRMAASA